MSTTTRRSRPWSRPPWSFRPGFIIAVVAVSVAAAAGGCQAPAPGRDGSADVVYAHAAIATDHAVASAAGREMLELGGNAVDAAVAASFCLSVVRPHSCGIGGGGFMVIHDDGEAIALDYRETAPSGVGPEYYVDLDQPGASRIGVRAVGVPGTVAGLLHALNSYGTLDRAVVLAPAIRAAEEGFPADRNYLAAVRDVARRLGEHPEARPGAAYIWEHLCREGQVAPGEIVTNPQQARALRLIAEGGAAAFYEGEIAAAIAAVMEAGGGPISGADLAGYVVTEAVPLRGRYGSYEILSMPPPSSGGVAMQQVLGLLERRGLVPTPRAARRYPHNSPEYVHLVTEAMKHAFADRAEWLADPAFERVPVDRLLAGAYLDDRALSIWEDTTREVEVYGTAAPPPADGGTSHISVLDADGMAVACTETINLPFGSLVSVPGFGFALNNEMDDFTTRPGEANAFGLRQSDRNLPAPGKRPLSSMSPTIVLDEERKVRLVVGAAGGPRIISGTLQVMLNSLVFDMMPREAIAAPRFHHQWLPDTLYFEDGWDDVGTIAILVGFNHEWARREDVGHVQAVGTDAHGIRAASDPRKGGWPAGY